MSTGKKNRKSPITSACSGRASRARKAASERPPTTAILAARRMTRTWRLANSSTVLAPSVTTSRAGSSWIDTDQQQLVDQLTTRTVWRNLPDCALGPARPAGGRDTAATRTNQTGGNDPFGPRDPDQYCFTRLSRAARFKLPPLSRRATDDKPELCRFPRLRMTM
eukprot:scaffold1239_cov175-Pinguiococcus_pyrenoidosus.AAC.51